MAKLFKRKGNRRKTSVANGQIELSQKKLSTKQEHPFVFGQLSAGTRVRARISLPSRGSHMAVKKPAPPLRRVTQASFDETVQENIDEFDLTPEEALSDAVKEFELQGVVLSDIDKSYAGPEGRGEHPVIGLTKAFVEAVESSWDTTTAVSTPDSTAAAAVKTTADALRLSITSQDPCPGWGAACVGAGGVQGAHLFVTKYAGLGGKNSEDDSSQDLLHTALEVLGSILTADEAKVTFASLKFPMAFTNETWLNCKTWKTKAAFAKVVGNASLRCEASKGAFVKAGVETCLVSLLGECTRESTSGVESAGGVVSTSGVESTSCVASTRGVQSTAITVGSDDFKRSALREACIAARALTTGDDPREPASGAFAHARALAKAGAAASLCAAFRTESLESNVDLSLLQQIAAALRHVAVNDDICKETSDKGGLRIALQLLKSTATSSAKTTKACAQLVRQLAGSDHVKPLIVSLGGIEALSHGVCVFGERAEIAAEREAKEKVAETCDSTAGTNNTDDAHACLAAVEQCVGALAATCLKNCEASTKCAAKLVFETVADTMALTSAIEKPGVQRQVRIGPFPNPADCLPIQD